MIRSMTFNVLYLNEAVNAGFSLVFCMTQLCADLDFFNAGGMQGNPTLLLVFACACVCVCACVFVRDKPLFLQNIKRLLNDPLRAMLLF